MSHSNVTSIISLFNMFWNKNTTSFLKFQHIPKPPCHILEKYEDFDFALFALYQSIFKTTDYK